MIEPRSLLGGACGLALLAAGLTVISCADVPSTIECKAACAVASRCGMLPSVLGGALGASRPSNKKECIRRCETSDAGATKISSLLEALVPQTIDGEDNLAKTITDYEQPPLCDSTGTEACEQLVDSLRSTSETSEIELTTTLTVRMVSAASYVANNSLRSWCCFEFASELDDDPANPEGNEPTTNIDELAVVESLLEDTHTCLRTLHDDAKEALEHLQKTDPTENDLTEAQRLCQEMYTLWPPAEEIDFDGVCQYARMSSQLQQSGLDELSCDAESMVLALDTIMPALGEALSDWNLQAGGPLVTDGRTFRDLEDLREHTQATLRDELTRPRGFLEDACEELLVDGASCDELGDDDAKCVGGPVCSPADCLEEDFDAPSCDISQCDNDSSPPGQECDLLGITGIRLGYRTSRGLETFGEPITNCSGATDVTTVFEEVQIGPLTPIAVVTGTLPRFLAPDDESSGRPYRWIVEGNTRWVPAGVAELELPSPRLEYLENGLENPLESLGWVTRRLPTGKSCDDEPSQCEGYFNDNCSNGLDDDGDGLIDGAEPWCDCLFEELVNRCVVVPPGHAAPPCCVDATSPDCNPSLPSVCLTQ